MNLIIGIDASRCRSGGAIDHLRGIIGHLDPAAHGISSVHVWAHENLLGVLPCAHWLVLHSPRELSGGLLMQLWWQAFKLKRELSHYGCHILFSADASTLSSFKPCAVLSQDLVAYEKGILSLYPFGLRKIRHLINFFLQNRAIRSANGVIFLTNHAKSQVEDATGPIAYKAVIPHGCHAMFRRHQWVPREARDIISVVYVSPLWVFKHHDSVIAAAAMLKKRGTSIHLQFVGAYDASDATRLKDHDVRRGGLAEQDVQFMGNVPHDALPAMIASNDIFLFASSCESFGITLLEGMALGMPIACSSLSSLPETLRDGGVYFDPRKPASIADALEHLIRNRELQAGLSQRAKALANEYSWAKTADETFSFIVSTYRRAT